MGNVRSDADLLAALRGGDKEAYAALWRRHSPAAYRYANRLLPEGADDLVAESFLDIYQQLTTTGAGPEFAFRSYLKAVLRNKASRARGELSRLVNGGIGTEDDSVLAEHADLIDHRDSLAIVEQRALSVDVAAALDELPERWRRVLLLAEVAGASRPEIAKELGIKPNAVSALQRRARAGLRLQWLSRQIPVALREDQAHVARLFPRYLTDPRDHALAAEVASHLAVCTECDELLRGMRGASTRPRANPLTVLLSSAGVGVPTTLWGGTGTSASAALLGATGAGLSGWAALAGAGALTAGLVFAALTVANPPGPVDPKPAATHILASPDPVPESAAPGPSVPSPGPAPVRASPAPPVPPASVPPTGRRIVDPEIPGLVVDGDAVSLPSTAQPRPADPGTPGPGADPDGGLSPGMTTPTTTRGYLAPVLTGRSTPGVTIGIDADWNALGTDAKPDWHRYSTQAGPDGSWAFDLRAIFHVRGTYQYRVWAFDDTRASTATTGEFSVAPVEVQGFGVPGEELSIEEAKTTGVVITVTGPPNGVVYAGTIEGHSALIALDDTGFARKRILMASYGWYYFTFGVLEDGFLGATTEHGVDVYDPDVVFGPWGPDPETMMFTVTDP